MISYFLISAFFSTILYLFLHKKTRINLKYLYLDNIAVIFFSAICSFSIGIFIPEKFFCVSYLVDFVLVIISIYGLAMVRFWRVPKRRIIAGSDEVVSPADGNVIYITQVEAGEIPVSIKGNTSSALAELIKTGLLARPCWLVGINMTLFDVHKNCAPVDGVVLLNQHFSGKFLSLKNKRALTENERNTYVIEGQNCKIGIVQIASRLVRRIDSYVKEGDKIRCGDWLGMIRFGSQVDIIIPRDYSIKVKIRDQVYAGSTVIAGISIR